VVYNAEGLIAKELPEGLTLGKDVQLHMYVNGNPVLSTLPAIIDEGCLDEIEAGIAVSRKRPNSPWIVLLYELNETCTKTLEEFTAKNKGKKIAIVLNGDLVDVQLIRKTITTGKGRFAGRFDNLDEASAMAARLR